MLDEHRLAGEVALVHAADLRHRHVRLVDHDEVVVGEVVEQRVRRRAGAAPVDVARVVLDAAAEPDLAHHLEVVARAHAQPLGLEQLALPLELGEPLVQLFLDRDDGGLHALLARRVVRGREDREVDDVVGDDLARDGVEPRDLLDRVAPPLDAVAGLLVRREHLERVALHAERAARPAHVVARVLDVDEPLHRELERDVGALVRPQDLPLVLLGRSEPVDARDARHDQHVAPPEERGGRRVPEPLDLVVDRAVLLDVRVGRRDVRLGLVVVVVAHEVLDRVVGEHLAELVRELGGERLVRRDHQGRSLHLLDHVRDRERLAGAGGAEQRDVLVAGPHGRGELLDRRRLVAGRPELRAQGERGHTVSLWSGHDIDACSRRPPLPRCRNVAHELNREDSDAPEDRLADPGARHRPGRHVRHGRGRRSTTLRRSDHPGHPDLVLVASRGRRAVPAQGAGLRRGHAVCPRRHRSGVVRAHELRARSHARRTAVDVRRRLCGVGRPHHRRLPRPNGRRHVPLLGAVAHGRGRGTGVHDR